MKKILFTSYSHDWNDTRILYKEALSLKKAGFNVTHLCKYDKNAKSFHGVEILHYNCILRKNKFLKLIDFFRVAYNYDADIYHCNEVESWLICVFIKFLKKNCTVIFDVHEHYPSRTREPHTSLFIKILGPNIVYLAYRVFLPFTDKIILAKRSISHDFKRHQEKIAYIFNYPILGIEDIDKSNRLLSSKKKVLDDLQVSSEQRLIVHVGVISKTRGWPQLVRAISMSKYKEIIRVLILGTVSDSVDEFKLLAKQNGVDKNFIFVDNVPYTEVFKYLNASELGLVLYQPGILNHVFGFPIKMYDYMFSKLPFLAPDFAIEVAPVVTESMCGLLVNTSSPSDIQGKIDYLLDNKEIAVTMGNNGYHACISQYNWSVEEKKLVALYNEYAHFKN